MQIPARFLLAIFVALFLPALLLASPQPQGTYVTTITETEAPPEMKETVGTWEVTLAEGNQFNVATKGETVVKGEYQINKDQIVFQDKEGRMSCPESERTGTYKWVLNGTELTFTKVEDKCKGRGLVLLTHPLRKKE